MRVYLTLCYTLLTCGHLHADVPTDDNISAPPSIKRSVAWAKTLRGSLKKQILNSRKTDQNTLSGKVYFWKNQALLNQVQLQLTENEFSSTLAETSSDASGSFSIVAGDTFGKRLIASKEISEAETGSVISSADALAALKIAVGINPNPDPDGAGPRVPAIVSPYQYIAADINGDQRVTSADALAVLKMAVKLPNSTPRRWVFVEEKFDFWDESLNNGNGGYRTNKGSVISDVSGSVLENANQSNVNFVGILMGDVNGNWSAPSGSQRLENSYFQDLQTQIGGLLGQWGVILDDIPPVITLTGPDNMVHEQGIRYLDQGATATDDQDGEVSVVRTGEVGSAAGIYVINYTAIDKSGNRSSAQRLISVTDSSSPVIELTGGATMAIAFGNTYSEPGVSATDLVDGTVSVSSSGIVGSALGTYTLSYTASDSAGNSTQVIRTVTVSQEDQIISANTNLLGFELPAAITILETE